MKPILSNNSNYSVVISVFEFKNCKSKLADMRDVKVKCVYQNALETEQFSITLHFGNHSFKMFLVLFDMSIIYELY